MNLSILYWLFQLWGLVLVHSKKDGKDEHEKTYCGPEFRKRDCATPLDLSKQELAKGDGGRDESLESHDSEALLWERSFNDPKLINLFGRDVLSGLAAGEDHDVLVERIVTENESNDDIFDKLEAWYELSHQLEKRAKYTWHAKDSPDFDKIKKRGHYYVFCEGQGDLIYKTSPYTKGKVLYDSENWAECDNYKLKKGGQMHASRNTGKNGEGDGYVTEHVLERQMIQQFAKARLEGIAISRKPEKKLDPQTGQTGDSRTGDNGQAHDSDDHNPVDTKTQGSTYCSYMQEYWEGVEEDPLGTKKWVLIPDYDGQMMPPLYVVGRAWPQTRSNKNEFLMFDRTANEVKSRAFKNGTSVHDNAHFQLDDDTGKSRDLTVVEQAHARFKLAVLVAKYMAHEDVQEIYKTQGNRVADAWKRAEAQVQKHWEDNVEPYEPLALDAMWLDWIKEYTETVRDKLWNDIKRWDTLFESQLRRFDDALKKLRKDTKDSSRELPADQQKLRHDLKAARTEFKRLKDLGGRRQTIRKPLGLTQGFLSWNDYVYRIAESSLSVVPTVLTY